MNSQHVKHNARFYCRKAPFNLASFDHIVEIIQKKMQFSIAYRERITYYFPFEETAFFMEPAYGKNLIFNISDQKISLVWLKMNLFFPSGIRF